MKESGDESLQEAQRARYRQEHPHIKSTVCFNEFEKLTQSVENSQWQERHPERSEGSAANNTKFML